jgi:hypothetical protein
MFVRRIYQVRRLAAVNNYEAPQRKRPLMKRVLSFILASSWHGALCLGDLLLACNRVSCM